MATIASHNGESLVAPKWMMIVVPIVTGLIGSAIGVLSILFVAVTQQQLTAAMAQREQITSALWLAHYREVEALKELLEEREKHSSEKFQWLQDKVDRLVEERP